jgi:hypothetical protein
MEELFTGKLPGIKILIPPLPRHLFKGCCTDKEHSTNVKDEGYSLTLLRETIRFRHLLKSALLSMGADNFFVIDGVGALIGIPAGGNRRTAMEILLELERVSAPDGVHFNEIGYKNLSNTSNTTGSHKWNYGWIAHQN